MIDRISCLHHVDFCRTLSDAALAAVSAIAMPLRRPAGTLIQLAGETAEVMYVVCAGQVKISRVGPRGREQVIHVAGPGQHFNTVPIFDGGPCPANATALTEVALLALPRDALLRAVATHPDLAMALLREFGGRLRNMVSLVDELALHTVQGRLAQLLLRQARAAERGDELPPLTQAEMATRLGTVREMVARSLCSFESQGIVHVERGVITILDRAALAELSEQ